MEQMASLSDALVDVEFEQDWLASHTDRHASSVFIVSFIIFDSV